MNTKLWYDAPASSFCEGLPVGNGSLGGIVYGGIPEGFMTLNLDTLWSGTGRRQEKKINKRVLDDAKKLCMSGEYFEAQNVIEGKMLGQYNESYMPLGMFRYRYNDIEKYEKYRRELDLEKGIVKTEFVYKNTCYDSEVFSSYPDKAIVMKFSCESEAKMCMEFWLESKLQFLAAVRKENGLVIFGNAPGHVDPNYVESSNPIVYQYKNPGMPFCCSMHIDAKDGEVSCVNGKIRVHGAKEIRVILTAADGYCTGTYKIDASVDRCLDSCEQMMEKVRGKTYEELMEAHVKDYSSLFNKSMLYLEGEKIELPLNERLKRFKDGNPDPELYCLYYHYNRYLLISSSRKGTQPANLQGIWSESIRPVWSSNWTININTEMNYWPAGICNLTECFDPLLCMLEEMSEAGKETAKNYYHCRGWAANHNVDIWRHTEPVSGLAKYAYWPMGGVWLSAQIFDYYKYTGNKELLRNRIYPVMAGSARFCLDWMERGEDGKYRTPLSTSPENTFKDDCGRECAVSAGSTMDLALIKELFKNVCYASELLGIQDEIVEEIKEVYVKIPDYQIGKYGQIQEWKEDFTEEDPGHRHFSALAGFHPGTTINKYDTPELIEGVKSFIERRLLYGGGHIGWSCAWLINFCARLEDGNGALFFLNNLLKKSSYDNLFDLHPPLGESPGEREVFQIDGNFGAASGIAGMLLRSCYNKIELLPALPEEWKNGKVKGLLGEGGITVNIEWENNSLLRAELYSEIPQETEVRYRDQIRRVYLKEKEWVEIKKDPKEKALHLEKNTCI